MKFMRFFSSSRFLLLCICAVVFLNVFVVSSINVSAALPEIGPQDFFNGSVCKKIVNENGEIVYEAQYGPGTLFDYDFVDVWGYASINYYGYEGYSYDYSYTVTTSVYVQVPEDCYAVFRYDLKSIKDGTSNGYQQTVENGFSTISFEIPSGYFCSGISLQSKWFVSGGNSQLLVIFPSVGYSGGNDTSEELVSAVGEQTKATNNIFDSITAFFSTFFTNIQNAILGLFIPDQAKIDGFFDDVKLLFENNLGFIYELTVWVTDFLLELKNSVVGDCIITFPGIKFMEYEIYPETDINLQSILDDFSVLQTACKLATSILLALATINLAQNKLKEWLR